MNKALIFNIISLSVNNLEVMPIYYQFQSI